MTNGTTPCISGGYTTMMTEDDSDLIRRSDALECFHDWVDKYGDVHTPDEMAEYRAIEALPSAQPLVLTCDGCRLVGTYDTDFPCSGCIRREKDYYEQER